MRIWLPALAALLMTAGSHGQATGMVTGHVYCADTNAPARLASVGLTAVPADGKLPKDIATSGDGGVGGTIQTSLDGSFVIANVPPGSYYVNAWAAGYLPSLSPNEATPTGTADTEKAEARLPMVVVNAGRSAEIDVRLQRGAAVSGTLRYDDGSPAPGAIVMALHKQNGKWEPTMYRFLGISLAAVPSITDDTGHFRVAGLTTQDYILIATLEHLNFHTNDSSRKGELTLVHSMMKVYSGDTVLEEKAVPFALGSGEERANMDITIPLNRLHTVTGNVVAASDGHTLRGGMVQVVATEGGDSIADADIDKDGSFHMDGVPEGSFELKIRDARDDESHASASRYADLSQPLRVEGDVSGLVVAVSQKTGNSR